VTNGGHVPTYIARYWVNLFDARHPGWTNRLLDPPFWREVVDGVPDHLFWSLRQSMKAEMLTGVRELLLKQYRRNRIGRARTDQMVATLSAENTRPLVIGFARRFATYKRAVLLFNDRARLMSTFTSDSDQVYQQIAHARPTGRTTLDADRLAAAGIGAAHALTDLEPDVSRCLVEAGRLLESLAVRVAGHLPAPAATTLLEDA
jgi:glucan phosphorylase